MWDELKEFNTKKVQQVTDEPQTLLKMRSVGDRSINNSLFTESKAGFFRQPEWSAVLSELWVGPPPGLEAQSERREPELLAPC